MFAIDNTIKYIKTIVINFQNKVKPENNEHICTLIIAIWKWSEVETYIFVDYISKWFIK